MSCVIANEQIMNAHRRGQLHVEIPPRAIITAQARETAERLGIKLLDWPVEKPAVPRVDGAVSMRRILYRRHPGWKPPQRRLSDCSPALNRLAVVGVGGVGMNVAHLAANRNVAEEIALIDVLPGLAESTALDLRHTRGSTRSTARITGGESMNGLVDSELVIVTAGQPRTPGMSRSDLLSVNGRLIRSIGESIASLAPASIVIVVSNPLDEMTYLMLRTTGFPRERVLGMAGTLDSARFRNALSRAAGVPVTDVDAITLGSHGEEMVPVVSKASIRDRPVGEFLSGEEIDACCQQTVSAGADVVALRKKGSATIAPAHATMELIDSIRGATSGPIPVSVLLNGEYGIEDTVLGAPCELGRSGVLNIVEMALSADELSSLQYAAAAVQARQRAN